MQPHCRTLVDDVRALVAYLGRIHPQIDEQRTVILGHSEGAVIAPIIAAEDRESGRLLCS